MQLSKRVIIPELDENYGGQLVDILRDWEGNDSGGSILSTLNGAMGRDSPAVLKAYTGRQRHRDQGLFSLPRFGDHNLIQAMQRLDISLSSCPTLLHGSFCIDLERGVTGYWTGGEQPTSRDEYRSENFEQTFVIAGTAIDIARELTQSHGFELRRLTTSEQARCVDFRERIALEDLQKYEASLVFPR